MYVVNFDNDNGFAIVPCDENAEDIIAVVPQGNYDPGLAVDNDGFNFYMAAAADYLSTLPTIERDTIGPLPLIPTDSIQPPAPGKDEILWHFKGGPVMNQKWGQRHPYGWHCPNGVSGCVATAIATAMAYFHFQDGVSKTMVYTYPERDIDSQEINWTEVLRHKKSKPYYNALVDDTCYAENKDYSHKTIARICRQIGKDAGSKYNICPDYKDNNTSTKSSQVKKMAERYMPPTRKVEENDYDYTMICKTIDCGIGIVY